MSGKITLKKTCEACPEQYDAFYGPHRVGYLRLRHGSFRVQCPWVGGEIVYQSNPKGDGIFEDDEREEELTRAKSAIMIWYKKQKQLERA